MSNPFKNGGGAQLPSYLERCVREGIVDRETACRVEKLRMSTGIGARRNTPAGLPALGAEPDAPYDPTLLAAPVSSEQTFDNFVSCQANAFPVEVARTVAGRSTSSASYNPLYLYGEVGLGKTHLLSAIANAADGKRSLLVNAVDLDAELERARRRSCRAELREWLFSADLLLVDDVQLCEGNESLQLELFAVLNHLIRGGRSIVVSCDVPPTRLRGVETRLISRLERGVIVGLQMCAKPQRVEILRRAFGTSMLPEEVLQYVAEHATASVRHMKAAARQLLAISADTDTAITVDLARAVVPLPGDLARESSALAAGAKTSESGAASAAEAGAAIFKHMLDAAESPEEQALALQIALGERLRQLREAGTTGAEVARLERTVELLRAGRIQDAMEQLGT